MCKEASEGGVPTVTQHAPSWGRPLSLLLNLSGTSQSNCQSQTEPEGNPKSLVEDAGSSLRAADSHGAFHVHTLPHPTSSWFSRAHILSRRASSPADKPQKMVSKAEGQEEILYRKKGVCLVGEVEFSYIVLIV